MTASRVVAASGGSYFAARVISSCTVAYERVLISGGRLGKVSSARYWGAKENASALRDPCEIECCGCLGCDISYFCEFAQLGRVCLAILFLGGSDDGLDFIFAALNSLLRFGSRWCKPLYHHGGQAVAEEFEVRHLVGGGHQRDRHK